MLKFYGLGFQVGHIGDGWLISSPQCLIPHCGWLRWMEVVGMLSWAICLEPWFWFDSLILFMESDGAEMSKMVYSLVWTEMSGTSESGLGVSPCNLSIC